MATSEVSGLATTPTTKATRVPKKEMGKDDFLILLTKQLQNQDPMKPMDNMEFVSQMSSFSTLEQITNMSKNMEKFLTKSDEQYKVQAMRLLGTQVTATPADAPEGISGIIESVKFVDGSAVYRMAGKDIKSTDIQLIGLPKSTQS